MFKEDYLTKVSIPSCLIEAKEEIKFLKFKKEEERKKDEYINILKQAIVSLPTFTMRVNADRKEELIYLKQVLKQAYEDELEFEKKQKFFLALKYFPVESER